MNSHLPLQEYRCTCGKLLFKGTLALCSVEIKCRCCGVVALYERFDMNGFSIVDSDAQGRVEEIFFGDEVPAPFVREYVLGKSLPELYPLLRDSSAAREALSRSSAEPYHVRDNVLLLHDGISMPVSSCIIVRNKKGGHRIFNWKNES